MNIKRLVALFACLLLTQVILGCAAKETAKPVVKEKGVYQETDVVGRPIEKAETQKRIANPELLEVQSPAFTNGQRIPDRFSKTIETGGNNVSLPLQWSAVPSGTKSIAIIMIDKATIAGNWVHWVIVNIPPEITSIPEGASGKTMPPNAVELDNSFQEQGYGGPQPPAGSGVHEYQIRAYALIEKSVDLGKRTSFEEFEKAVDGKALAIGTLTGTFSR